MRILGFLGSPRLKGNCAKLIKSALNGANHAGAETHLFELIEHNILDCRGCSNCFLKDPELPIGKCTLKDDAHGILQAYVKADGYIFATPVYDLYITALMKRFLERKIALTHRDPDSGTLMPFPRCPANFKKKASMIVTGNSKDEYKEAMADPCFEALGGHLALEQIDTVDKIYVGSVETITKEDFAKRLEKTRQMGIRLVEEIEKAQKED